jgi:uncharacterized membrane protein required for colicin V production
MMGLAWPDVAIGFIVAFGTLAGFKRGFVAEVTGLVALVFGIAAGIAYAGTWDGWVHARAHLDGASAHVAGMVLYGLATWAVVLVLGRAFGGVAKLPLVASLNAALGGLAGCVKAVLLTWTVLYVALFFPLGDDVRAGLHESRLVAVLQSPNAGLDDRLRDALPWFVRPFSESLFERHRV